VKAPVRASAALALVATAIAACDPAPDARPASAPPPGTAVAPAAPSPPERPGGVQLVVGEAQGVDPAAVGRMYGAAREALAHCPKGGGGSVRVKVVKQGASMHMNIEPGATLDPRSHDCVLESLSTVELPDTGGNAGGPTTPPSGFTSLLTISW
jgi:hypothetical protein